MTALTQQQVEAELTEMRRLRTSAQLAHREYLAQRPGDEARLAAARWTGSVEEVATRRRIAARGELEAVSHWLTADHYERALSHCEATIAHGYAPWVRMAIAQAHETAPRRATLMSPEAIPSESSPAKALSTGTALWICFTVGLLVLLGPILLFMVLTSASSPMALAVLVFLLLLQVRRRRKPQPAADPL